MRWWVWLAVIAAGCGDAGEVSTTPGATSGAGASGGASSTTTTSAASGGSSAGVGGSGGAAELPPCMPIPACDAPPPDPGEAVDWNDSFTPYVVTSQGDPQHRGRDLFLRPGDPQWVLAKFTYGWADKDLVGEDVDVYLLRDCGDVWEHLGTATTTDDEDHGAVEGVSDTGGRIYFPIPGDKALAVGRHRFHLVVRGDLSTTELFIEVVPVGTTIFVSDVDGTLTTSENEEFSALASGDLPEVRPHAAEVMQSLAAKGLRPFYLTARPEWLAERTRDFLRERGFPPGIMHTTLSKDGALGNEAIVYKTSELQAAADKALFPAWAFGNTDSDATAYENLSIEPLDRRIFVQFDDPNGGRRIEGYDELLSEAATRPPACQ